MVTSNPFDQGVENISLEDVTNELEGEAPLEFTNVVGVEEGVYDAVITNISPIRKTVPASTKPGKEHPGFKLDLARIEVELQIPPYKGWKRNYDIMIGRKADGTWVDGTFRTSVRRVIGESAYQSQIRVQPNAKKQYEKAFELLKGQKCRISFVKGEGKTRAYPAGNLLAAASDVPPARTGTKL